MIPAPRVFARMVVTFGIVCVGWVFFRADSILEGYQILIRIVLDVFDVGAYAELVDRIDHQRLFKQSAILLGLFVIAEWVQRHRLCPLDFSTRTPTAIRWAAYSCVIWMTLYYMPAQGSQQFIYFEF